MNSARSLTTTLCLAVCAMTLTPVALAAGRDARLADAWRTAEDRGWLEAVISVSDSAPMRRFARDIAGWQQQRAGPVSSELLDFYSAKPAAGTTPREWLISDASATPGLLRLIQFNDPGSEVIRAGAMPWDTGGILSLMSRSNRTAAIYRAAQRQGWNAFNDLVVLNLPDTGVSLTNVIIRGPDAISISIYERLNPRMPDEPDLLRLRRPFNSMQSVRDIAVARRFYTEVLGFEIVNRGEFTNPVRAPNNFGAPANLVVSQPLPFTIVGPRRDGPTQIELVQMPGVEGRDLAQRARPPNLGVLGLRFPVSHLAAVQSRLAAQQWPIARGPTRLQLMPWGSVDVLAVQAPDGAWLEFMQKAAP